MLAAMLAGMAPIVPPAPSQPGQTAQTVAAKSKEKHNKKGNKAPKCTIKGTNGDDVLRGTGRADRICGLGGDDTLIGRGGNDTLIGGGGKDRLYGDDKVNAASRERRVSGDGVAPSEGDDDLSGGKGEDVLNGGPGDDSLAGGPGADELDGGPGINPCLGDGRGTWDVEDEMDIATCEDVTAPIVVSASVEPDTIDTRSSDQTLIYTITVRDDIAGLWLGDVSPGYVTAFFGPAGGTSTQFTNFGCSSRDNLGENHFSSSTIVRQTDDGRVLEATCVAEMRVRRFAKLGQWVPKAHGATHVDDLLRNSRWWGPEGDKDWLPGFFNGPAS